MEYVDMEEESWLLPRLNELAQEKRICRRMQVSKELDLQAIQIRVQIGTWQSTRNSRSVQEYNAEK